MRRFCTGATKTYPTIFMVQFNQEFLTFAFFGEDSGYREEGYFNLDSCIFYVSPDECSSPSNPYRS